MANPVYFIMGVSGCGKSTIGKLLSEKTSIPFYDGDDFHPQANIDKMAAGQPLNDSDRQDWLETLHDLAKREQTKKGAIIACSALKKSYRDILTNDLNTPNLFIFLNGDFATIQKRLEERGGHFMPSSLLQSQFDTLQPPKNALVFDIKNSPTEIVAAILSIMS